MNSAGYSKWDAFRSQSRESALKSELAPWMIRALQLVKFLIFVTAHILLICGTAVSKLAVILVATNVSPKPSRSLYNQRCSSGVHRTSETTSAMLGSLWLIQNIPDLLCVLLALWRMISGSKSSKGFSLTLVFVECCRAAGASLLFFCIFPSLDPTRCVVLTVSALFLPIYQAVRRSIHRSFDPSASLWRRLSRLFSSFPRAVLFLCVMSSCYLWSVLEFPFSHYVLLPVALILSAIGFWDGWIGSSHSSASTFFLYQLKYGMCDINASNRFVLSISRCAVSSLVFIYSMHYQGVHVEFLLRSFASESKSRELYALAVWVVAINYLLRLSARFLAAMNMRVLSVLHPILVVPPLLLIFFNTVCYVFPLCSVGSFLARYFLQWQCFSSTVSVYPFSDIYVTSIWVVAYLFWAHSLVKIPQFDQSDDIIDSMPSVVNGLCIEQSLIVYHHSISKKHYDCACDEYFYADDDRDAGELRITNDEIDKTVTLYVCATMWHETRYEMTQMIKSIMRLDREHSILLSEKSQKNQLKFRLEAHIFFDDAWEEQTECGRSPNTFFKELFHLLLELTDSNNEGDDLSVSSTRVLLNTPYGGRLVLRLPAGTLLFVHLKDKKLIRVKKRWSQVMYMYYLLGHRIMDSHMSVEDRQLEADNTYLLAIDGDSKFGPGAVLKLLHLMNVKSEIGCACGRIHPIGDGIMVWYQKFEYAIAHWFQKAAEHVFGCVLCAPGCFSLFRASALMDDNVMHKYTKTACEPRHFVQYDQGEDRWLSTLLLKQGYRIEYAAAADAETYAPEGFNEFFNQRRRWTPSSIANTVDLLADYKRVCKNNESVSMLYIIYQMLVIGFSLVGPAIMFTMLVYAQVAAFEVASDRMIVYNAIPVLFFILICFVGDSSHQLVFARLASVVYAFIMLAVLVATTNQIILETAFSPTSMFVLAMVFIFVAAAFMHPREFFNIIYGFVFFLMIPCTYVFLTLYSLINLNVINWGTREAVSKAVGGAAKSEPFLERLAGLLGMRGVFSKFATLLTQPSTSKHEMATRIEALTSRIASLEAAASDSKEINEAREIPLGRLQILSTPTTVNRSPEEGCTPFSTISKPAEKDKDMESRFMWMDAEYLQVCSRGRLNASEEDFWNELIDQYLKPIEIPKEETKRNAVELAALRNRIASSILIMNGLLVLAIFLIQKHKEILSFQYKPFDGFQWMKLSEKTGKFELTGEPLKIEPLGLIIIIFLLGILIVQTIGMFIHRLNTLIGAFHEVSNMEDFVFYTSSSTDEDKILENARQMFDNANYYRAHGADGYTRANSDVQCSSNVLYKLQRARLANRLQRSSVPKRPNF